MSLQNLNNLKINQAAKFLGVSAKTLRRWETSGVLSPKRSLGNQRVYPLELLVDFKRLRSRSKRKYSRAVREIQTVLNAPKASKTVEKPIEGFGITRQQKFVLRGAFLSLAGFALIVGLERFGVFSFRTTLENENKLGSKLVNVKERASHALSYIVSPFVSKSKTVDQNIAFKRDENGKVLGIEDLQDAEFDITIPSNFSQDVIIEGDLTAPNITYTVTGGDGIEVTGGQNPLISLADDAVNGFGTITVGTTNIEAEGNDTLTFAAGSNVSIAVNTTTNQLTISSTDTDTNTNVSGWTDGGTNVALTTATDTVTIGSSLIISDGGLINLSAVLHDDSAAQGFKLPQNTSLTDLASGEGFLAYDTDDNLVKVFDGSAWTNISGASTTLQNAYDNDADGSNVIITESSADDSLIFRNPASGGTDTAYVVGIEQLAAGAIDTLNITNSGSGAGINLNASTLINIGNAGTDFTTTGGLTLAGTFTANGIATIGDGGDAITLSGTTLGLTSNAAGNDITLTSADDIIFDDAQLSSAINLSTSATSFTSGDTGIVDAINTAYGAATGGGGGLWTLASGVISPTTATHDFAIGGTTLAASIFSIDESAGTFLFGGDQSANPTLTFEATDADTGDFGFNTNDSFYFTGANVGIGDTSPDALFDIDSTATTTNVAGILNTSLTTGEILDITATYAPSDGSSNEAIDINLTHTPTSIADTFRGLDLNITEGANALANTLYGIYGTVDNSANTSTGTHTIYGGYFTAAGKTAGTTTAIGLYSTASGADSNYAAIFEAGNVGIGDTTPSSLLEVGNGTDSLQVSSVGDITFVDADSGATITGPAGGSLNITAASSQALALATTTAGDITLTPAGAGDVVIDTDSNTQVTLNGGGDGVDSLVLTDGDILISDGDLDLSGGDFNVTLDAGDGALFASNATATADALTTTLTGVGSDAIQINLTQSDDADSTDDSAALRLALTSNSGDADLLYGIDIGNITEGTAIEVAMRIGSGWTNLIEFEGATDNGFEAFLQITDPTADRTYILPNASGEICLVAAGNCAGSGTGVTTTGGTTNTLTKFTGTQTVGNSSITDDGTVVTFSVDADLNFAASENFSLTNTSASSDQVNLAISGITTNGVDGIALAFTQADDADATDINAGIDISVTGDSGDGDTLTGINIANLAGASAAATSYALQIGNAWDQNLYFNDTTTSVLLADGGTITITDGNNTLCTVTDAGTTGNLNCTGNITGGSGGTSGFWSRTGTTLSPATASDIVSIANTTTTGADFGITNTGVYTGTGIVNITANSATTGNVLSMSATGLTTGELINLDSTYTPTNGSTNEAIDINITNNPSTLANVMQGINLSLTDATTLANTLYGTYSTVDNSSNTAVGTHSIYGGYFTAAGKTAGTTTAIGLYASASGADSNYAAIFEAGNVGIGDTTPGATLEVGNGTDSLQVSSVGDITFVDADGAATITGPNGGALNINAASSQALALATTTAGNITLTPAGAGDVVIDTDSDTQLILNGGGDGVDSLVLTDGDILVSDGDLDLSGGDFNVVLDAADGVNISKGAAATVDVFNINGGTSATDGVDNLQLTFGVSAASGNVIDITPSYADATAGATSEDYYIIDIDAFTATQNAAGDTGSIRGLNIGNLTQTETAGTLTASAIRVGTGWDDILNYNGTTVINSTGQVVSTQLNGTLFSTDSDSASANTIIQGDTLTINGTATGIDVTHSGDTMTVALDTTEVGTTTWNAGATDPTWTFNTSGATDPTLAFANASLTIGSATTITATDTTTFNCTDCLNFDDFSDALTMDAATTITNATASDLSIDLTSTGDFLIKDSGAAIATFADTGAISFTPTSGVGITNTMAGAGNYAVTTATGTQTFTSSVVTGTTTTSGFIFDATAITSGTGLFATSDSITTGKLVDINTLAADTLTSGILLNVFSESTALTTGSLASFDWSPSPSATSTGDLVKIKIGTQGDLGTGANLFNILSDTTSLFSVSETAVTSSLPAAFNATGDVSIAYDLVFTNQTASYIKSNAPLYIESGETFENNNLTLRTYGTGDVVFDLTGAGGSVQIDGISTDNTGTAGVLGLDVDSLTTGHMGFRIDYEALSGGTAAADQFAQRIFLTQTDADSDLWGFAITANAVSTTIAGTNLYECLICLVNEENQAAAVKDAIFITSIGATSGAITNAINIADDDVTNDLVMQNGEIIDNNVNGDITFTQGAVTFTFDLDATDPGITTSDTNLDINEELVIELDGGAVTTAALCGNQGAGDAADTSNVKISDCSGTPVSDYMEMYSVEAGIEYGDVVAPSDTYVTSTDGVTMPKLTKTSSAYQKSTIGIASDKAGAGDFNSIGYNVREEDNPWPVALSGRLPVKVSQASDPIQKGDYITTSFESGKAMKAEYAGQMIGKALEDWNPGTSQDTVLVFVTTSWADPNTELVFDTNGNLIASTSDYSNSSQADYATEIADLEQRVSSLETTPGNGFDQLQGEIDLLTSRVDFLESEIEIIKNASGSGNIVYEATTSATLNSLVVLEDAILPDTVINGRLDIGTLSFDNIENSINAIGTLKIQDLGLGSIEFQAGKIVMDQVGNLVVNEGVIKGNDNFRGSAQIEVDEYEVQVLGAWDEAPVTVNVTPSYRTNVWVTDITNSGFIINVSSSPTVNEDIFWTAIW